MGSLSVVSAGRYTDAFTVSAGGVDDGAAQDAPVQHVATNEAHEKFLQLSKRGEYDGLRDRLLRIQSYPERAAQQKLLMDSLLDRPETHKNPAALVCALRDTRFGFHGYMYHHMKEKGEYRLWTLPLSYSDDTGLQAAAMLVAERARERLSLAGKYTPDFCGMYSDYAMSRQDKHEDRRVIRGTFLSVQNELVKQVAAAKGPYYEALAAGYLNTHTKSRIIDADQARLWMKKADDWEELSGQPAKARLVLALVR